MASERRPSASRTAAFLGSALLAAGVASRALGGVAPAPPAASPPPAAPSASGAPAAPAPATVEVLESRDVVHLLDGATVEGTVVGEGPNGVLVLVNDRGVPGKKVNLGPGGDLVLVNDREAMLPRERVVRVERGAPPESLVKAVYAIEIEDGLCVIAGKSAAAPATASPAPALPKPPPAPPASRPPKPPKPPAATPAGPDAKRVTKLLDAAMANPALRKFIEGNGGRSAVEKRLREDPALLNMMEQWVQRPGEAVKPPATPAPPKRPPRDRNRGNRGNRQNPPALPPVQDQPHIL